MSNIPPRVCNLTNFMVFPLRVKTLIHVKSLPLFSFFFWGVGEVSEHHLLKHLSFPGRAVVQTLRFSDSCGRLPPFTAFPRWPVSLCTRTPLFYTGMCLFQVVGEVSSLLFFLTVVAVHATPHQILGTPCPNEYSPFPHRTGEKAGFREGNWLDEVCRADTWQS